ncbi:MAG: ERCC4 domain-containing protein, partial [Candidatus Woesearchaeota archaeon]
RLEVADFVLSQRVGVEFKTTEDFVQSLIDQRILQQAKELKYTYARPLIVVQGKETIYSVRNVHPNALLGLLATLTVSYGIPVLFTTDAAETAKLLFFIAKHEQEETSNTISAYGTKKPQQLKEQQEAVINALPGLGMQASKALLRHFGSVKNIVLADKEALKAIELIGEKKAAKIKEVLESSYEE